MLENSALYLRRLFAFELVCAAVVSFIMCSDAARASQVDNGVKHNVVRRLYTSYSHHHPLSAGLLPTNTGSQTGTETRGNYRQTMSIINHHSNPPQLPEGRFRYNQNFPDNRQARAGMTKVQSEAMPTSSIFTNHFHQRLAGRQPRVNYDSGTGKSYSSYPVIIRKSSYKEAASPFLQQSSSSQIWDPRDAQKSYNDPPNVLKDQTVWQPSGPLFSSHTGRYQSTSLPTSRGHYSGYKDTNELIAARVQSPSSGIQSSKFHSFAGQTARHAPSISNNLDSSAIKSMSSPEKLTSSITDFSQGPDLVSRGETPRHKKLRSYLFKDPQVSFGGHETVNAVAGDGPSAFSTTPHEQRPPDAQVYKRFPSHFNQLQRAQEVKTPSNNANQLYRNTNVAQFGAQTDSFTKYQHTTVGTREVSVHPAPRRDVTMESFVPVPHDTGSKKYVVSSLVNTTAGGLVHPYKPGPTIKSIYGFRGFKHPELGAVKEPSVVSSSSSKEGTNFLRYSFDKGKFKIANTYPSLSPKYRFGETKAKTPTATPAELEKTPADYSSLSPATPEIAQTSIMPRSIISGFKEAQPVIPESVAGRDRNPDRKRFRIYRRLYGLKGFSRPPLDGAKTSVPEPDKSAKAQQGFEGFKLTGSKTLQQKSSRIHRWYSKIGETEPGSRHVSTESQNEQSSGGLEPLLKTTGSAESRFGPDKYKNSRNSHSFLGFRPVQNKTGTSDDKNHWKYKEQNPTRASESHRISSAYLRLAGDFKVQSTPKSDTRPPSETKLVAGKASLLSTSTSSTVRGKRVKGKHTNGKKLTESTFLTNNTAIIRLPKLPARIKAITYADILGSASFSGVSSVTPTTVISPDKYYSPDATATTRQEEREGHQTPPDEGEDFSSVEENKLVVGNEEAESDTKTTDFFLDNEGSGSGGFNMSDALSADTTKSKGRSEDLLERDYLRISTGNISFKSVAF